MSTETSVWLNTNTLIGFTTQRGNAWHYRADDQDAEPNHYEGAVPVEDVLRRLFNFTVVPYPVVFKVPCDVTDQEMAGIDKEGNPFKLVDSHAGRVGWLCDDNYDDMGVFSDGYLGHQYEEWLLNEVKNLLDDDLGIGSAGLLRNRGQAWVSVEVPENVTTPEGVEFRPHLVAATSFDGSLSTTYKRSITAVVCDNTLSAALGEKDQQVKVRHSRYSNLKLASAREALAIVHTLADDFSAEIARLCAWDVSAQQFAKHLDLLIPLPEQNGRGLTLAVNKRERITDLYDNDLRVAPWRGTGFGVLQAHNTWAQHYATVRGSVGRGLRNMENSLSGKTDQLDAEVLRTLSLVTS